MFEAMAFKLLAIFIGAVITKLRLYTLQQSRQVL